MNVRDLFGCRSMAEILVGCLTTRGCGFTSNAEDLAKICIDQSDIKSAWPCALHFCHSSGAAFCGISCDLYLRAATSSHACCVADVYPFVLPCWRRGVWRDSACAVSPVDAVSTLRGCCRGSDFRTHHHPFPRDRGRKLISCFDPFPSATRRGRSRRTRRFRAARAAQSVNQDDGLPFVHSTRIHFSVLCFRFRGAVHFQPLAHALRPHADALTGLCRVLWRFAVELFHNAPRLAAHQGQVAFAIDARQIHPDPQLPRPNFTQRVVWTAADGHERSVARSQLFDEYAESAVVPRGDRLHVDQRELNAIPNRLASRFFCPATDDRGPMFLVRCTRQQLRPLRRRRYNQANAQRRGRDADETSSGIGRRQGRRQTCLQFIHINWAHLSMVHVSGD